MDFEKLKQVAKLIRYYILTSTTEAGSGHPTSSLSATDLMTVLLYSGNFHFDLDNPQNPNNDRLIFSKGHASPLFYAMWVPAANPKSQAPKLKQIPNSKSQIQNERVVDGEELIKTLRKFGSPFEGHPTPAFKFTEAATGSLGQGLSVGVGMALAAKLDKLNYKTYVLLGDSEMAEGSVWEAMQIAAHYKLDNLIGILDVNRLGQRGETMYGHDVEEYQKRISAFGWDTTVIDGHDLGEIQKALEWAINPSRPSATLPSPGEGGKPKMIIAKTLKGKGVSFIENKDGWHGRALPAEDLKKALLELGEVDKALRGEIAKPVTSPHPSPISERVPKAGEVKSADYPKDKPVATRKAYGNALARLGEVYPNLVVLDGEVSNSTFAEIFKVKFPERFFEMYIAEQNMVGTALGLSRRGKIPFVSSFAAFLTRAFDQIRMSQYSEANIKFCGSHTGVSIGEDGASQMGLEDIAMFRTLQNSVVLYPSDAVSCEKLVEEAAKHKGNVYIRTTRKDTPIIYSPSPSPSHQRRGKEKNDSSPLPARRIGGRGEAGVEHEFRIGGSCVLRQSAHDRGTVVAAGITLHEALAAYEELKKQGINIRIIDLYSIKPLDIGTLQKAARETKAIITVEDHYPEGGIGEAVASVLLGNNSSQPPLTLRGGASPLKVRGDRGELWFYSLAVRKMPRSGKPNELLAYEEIDRKSIAEKVKESLE